MESDDELRVRLRQAIERSTDENERAELVAAWRCLRRQAVHQVGS